MTDISSFVSPGAHFLKETDLTPSQWHQLIELAALLKAAKKNGEEEQYLRGRNIALIFAKTSTRTRCAFEVAAADQGAHTTYLDPSGSQMGHKESVADTAKVLGRFFDGIEYRGDSQADVEILASDSGVPVWNGLTDEWHPTQMLADSLTMLEHSAGRDFSDIAYAYVGDARFNMGRSLLINGAMLGSDVRIVAPTPLLPPDEVIQEAKAIAAKTGARITVTDEIDAVAGVDFVHTDIWVSMGEPKDVWAERIALLMPYRVDQNLMDRAGKRSLFMHCLPSFHDLNTTVGKEIFEQFGLDGVEVTDEVFSSPRSVVFDQAENRLHTIKAVMVRSLGRQ
ncbi:ornithine carbamoyltransferase [Actinomycetaceae bacterium WB03_NA08]|uniref:Ornithine carbamoyltransferase n=1 Tax=Scrofimicrobium canadense TaxID=2652290 RepID=A0A6N7W210_9ACTO|nr:ornithine carbamoyltransferase [Scrofimicrobium canadense]MSS83325.1 ornithine carbamoyltransferase [Scrofimicrobium canadense]